MRPRARVAALSVLATTALAAPATAWAHAALLRTVPLPSGTVNSPPAQVSLTYSEAVEPRFAIVSVTDAAGRQETAGSPQRSPSNVDMLVVPLRRLAEGWYLVFWRVISADGHPVRGAFTFAVGPNAGPAPQFVVPSISETAATPGLLVARWATFLTLMTAVGLFVFHVAVARPLRRRLPAVSLRPLSLAFGIAIGLALVVTPIYVALATAQFALRSAFDLGDIVPLVRQSSFGRDYLQLELVLALFALAGTVAIALDRPDRRQRSVAELLALAGAVEALAASLLVPGLAGHAAQTSSRGLALPLDWLHLAAGSVWLGGLVGVLVLWVSLGPDRRAAGLALAVPRFSTIAFVSVVALLGSGIGASLVHLPTLSSLWHTSYGKTLVVKIALLLAALGLAAVNLTRTKPALQAAASEPGAVVGGAVSLLRGMVGGEVVLVVSALFAAGLLSSLAPPPKPLGSLARASVHVGPGPVTQVVRRGRYRLAFRVSPNRVAIPNAFTVAITRDGRPLRRAGVTATFTMLDMSMGQLAYRLPETRPGTYGRSAPALVMVGRWGLDFEIEPRGRAPFNVLLIDRARG